MELGFCKRCSGRMALVTRFMTERDYLGREGIDKPSSEAAIDKLVDNDGKPIPQNPETGTYLKPAVQIAIVECGNCHIPDWKHPEQLIINAAAKNKRANEEARAQQTATPPSASTYSPQSAFDELLRGMGKLQTQIESLKTEHKAELEQIRADMAEINAELGRRIEEVQSAQPGRRRVNA